MKHLYRSRGFALPVIMLVSLSLMIVALSMLQSSSSVRSTIEDQYYNRLAFEAAQDGVTAAVSCLSKNTFSQSWPQGVPMTEQQDCSGAPVSPSVTLSPQPNTRSSYAVGNIEGTSDGAVLVQSTGTVNKLVDGSSTVAKTYTQTLKRVANSGYVKFTGSTLGYYYQVPVGNTTNGGMFYYIGGSDGKIRAAGSNDFGQLANGTTSNNLTPQLVTMPAGKSAAAIYTNFLSQGWNIFMRMTDGSVYGAGYGSEGQLGNGHSDTVNSSYQPFQLPSGETARYVGPAGHATFVITNSNNIYAAGSCNQGELGTGQFTPDPDCGSNNGPQSIPQRVQLPTPNIADPNTIPDNVIVSDYATVYVVMKGGKLYGWGNNYEGELCDGTANNSNTPKQVGTWGNPGQPKVKNLAFDGITLYVVDSAGKAWSCGSNEYGELGIGTIGGFVRSFQQIPIPASAGSAVDIATDELYFAVSTTSGRVFGAGYNKYGQLGNNSPTTKQSTLVEFQLPAGVLAKSIYIASVGFRSDGINDTFVVGTNGKVYGAGGNVYGQLGIGNTSTYEPKPREMSVFNGTTLKAKSVTTGLGTTIIIASNGKYYTVGNNQYGQLGTGDTVNRSTPAEATFFQSASGSFIF